MKYLVVDGNLHGTGIRDNYEGDYYELDSLNISQSLISKISLWLKKYEEEHYLSFVNKTINDELDIEGREIARLLKNELGDVKIYYYSAAYLIKEII